MSERLMRQRVVHALASLDAFSVENRVYPGTPDVNYIDGWLELKWLKDWPKRENSPVIIKHLTQQQKIWMLRRSRKGGKAHLVIQCRSQWLVYTPEAVLDPAFGKTLTRRQLEELAWLQLGRPEELGTYLVPIVDGLVINEAN